jgi:hypothetical protein
LEVEEFYDEVNDPYEWINMAYKGGGDKAVKNELSRHLPLDNKAPAGLEKCQVEQKKSRRTADD